MGEACVLSGLFLNFVFVLQKSPVPSCEKRKMRRREGRISGSVPVLHLPPCARPQASQPAAPGVAVTAPPTLSGWEDNATHPAETKPLSPHERGQSAPCGSPPAGDSGSLQIDTCRKGRRAHWKETLWSGHTFRLVINTEPTPRHQPSHTRARTHICSSPTRVTGYGSHFEKVDENKTKK